MEHLQIRGSSQLFFIPNVDFNPETGECRISGESFPEDVFNFYKPILNWLRMYLDKRKPLSFHCRLSYYNTMTSKVLSEIFEMLSSYKSSGGVVEVFWYYSGQPSLSLLEEIKDFEDDASLQITTINEIK